MGAGLAKSWLAGILAISVVVFLFWDGPLWAAARGSSHVGRIGISYLIVPALVAAALLFTKRWQWKRFASSLAIVWAVKLVVTASLYSWLAPGTTSKYDPSRSWENGESDAKAVAAVRYAPAAELGEISDVSGVVSQSGTPVAGVILILDRPPPGLPAPRPGDLEWRIGRNGHDRPVRLAWKGDRLSITNDDEQLHTVRLSGTGRDRRNVAVPPSATVKSGPLSAPGVYELLCDKHPEEKSTLVVVDHPYATVSGESGEFQLRGVPPGSLGLRVFDASGSWTEHRISIPAAEDLEISLDTGPDSASRQGDA